MIYGVYGKLDMIFEDMEYAANIPTDKFVYAFAYQEDERALNYFCKPVRGKVIGRFFYECKKNSDDLRKSIVSVYSRYFADTYEEAVEGFNILLKNRIEKLENEVVRLKEMLIKEEDNNEL